MSRLITAAYTRKDQVGRFRERRVGCFCTPKGAPHDYCAHCLILVGDDHHEVRTRPHLVPVLTDRFNPDEGRWVRGVHWREAAVCESCIEDLSSGRYGYTVRIEPLPPALRRRQVVDWARERGVPVPRRRHVGGFTRKADVAEGAA